MAGGVGAGLLCTGSCVCCRSEKTILGKLGVGSCCVLSRVFAVGRTKLSWESWAFGSLLCAGSCVCCRSEKTVVGKLGVW